MEQSMRTILVGDCAIEHLYEMTDPDAPTEVEFESQVVQALTCIYANYHCIVFGGSFELENRTCKPDLALVANDFSHWFVIEVELVSHSFEQHVLPQVVAFRYGDPQLDCISVLSRELEKPPERVKTLLDHVPRSVVVVANKREPQWQIALRAHDIQFLAISKFQSRFGVPAFEVDGTLEVLQESLGFAVYSATDRSLRFPKTVRLPSGAIQINDPAGSRSSWTVTRDDHCAWVTKDVGSASIAEGSYIQVVRTIDGRISLRRPSRDFH